MMTDRKYTDSVYDIGIAVDVGSTSIGVCCVNLSDKNEILSFSFTNPQHTYGADVVTRIKYCVEDDLMLHKMHMLVEEELHSQWIKHLGKQYPSISNVVYSGNTTMLHILRELPVIGLAQAPFTPVDLEYAQKCVSQNINYMYLPGFSAFVGADILSGAEYLEMGKEESYELLIDLGTNGELLLLNKKNGFATSTACGPVFDHVISGSKYGSESVNAIAACVKRGLIDETGKIADVFFEKGISIDETLVIKQENIRNFQLAKGAIYAGIQCLLKKASITTDEISKVYISGGLGFHMNWRAALTLKMLPQEFLNKIIISGNTSLEGAKRFLVASVKQKRDVLTEYNHIKKRTISFELADCDEFQEMYMHSLDF